MVRLLLAFSLSLLLIAMAVYAITSSALPLSTHEAIGAGVFFILGWTGLALAGSSIARRVRSGRQRGGVAGHDASRLP